MIVAIINNVPHTFLSMNDLINHEEYNNFVSINFSDNGLTQLPETLPTKLQILTFQNNSITKLPHLPTTIRQIFGKTNKLLRFPEITHCIFLEDVDFRDNYIENIDINFPKSVMNLDISFNKIKTINYEKIPIYTQINV